MNKNITIKVKPSNVKEFGRYLISIDEKLQSAFYRKVELHVDYVFIYNTFGYTWNWIYDEPITYINSIIIDYNTFMRQVKLERILK